MAERLGSEWRAVEITSGRRTGVLYVRDLLVARGALCDCNYCSHMKGYTTRRRALIEFLPAF